MRSTPKLAWALPHAWFIAVLLALWSYWVWPDVSVPLSPFSDGLYFWGLIKTIFTSGSWLHANGLGAPFVATTYDFPYSDSLLFLIIRLIHLFTDDAGIGWNVFYLVGLLATYATAFAVLRRRLGHDVVAAIGAFVFAMLPYHFYRAPHLLLAAYFIVPLVINVALDLAQTERDDGARLGRWIASHKIAIAISIAGAACGVYYAFFSCIAYLFSGVANSLRTRTWIGVRRSVVLAALASAMVLLDVAPSLRYWAAHGVNPAVAARNAGETEVYGLNLAMLLLPVDGHHSDVLNASGEKLRKQDVFGNEAVHASLGMLASAGFLVLLCASLRILSAPLKRGIGAAADLNLVLLLYATIGGFGFVFAGYISPQLRALNRVSVFIGFLSVYALATLATHAIPRMRGRWHRPRWTGAALVIATTAFVIFDQVPRQFPDRSPHIVARLQSVKRFVTGIESTLPAGAMILTIPYVPYPEGGVFANEGSYTMLRPYVYSRGTRWSYGAMKGRPDDNWIRTLSALPPLEQARVARIMGFAGIYVYRRQLADRGAALEQALAQVAGKPMVSDDNELAFHALNKLPQTDLSVPIPALFGDAFYEGERNDSATWHWARGNSYLALFNQSQAPLAYRVSFDLMTESERHVIVTQESQPGTPLWSGNLTPRAGAHVELGVQLAPGWNRFALASDAAAVRPGPRDQRLLAYGIRNLAYVPGR